MKNGELEFLNYFNNKKYITPTSVKSRIDLAFINKTKKILNKNNIRGKCYRSLDKDISENELRLSKMKFTEFSVDILNKVNTANKIIEKVDKLEFQKSIYSQKLKVKQTIPYLKTDITNSSKSIFTQSRFIKFQIPKLPKLGLEYKNIFKSNKKNLSSVMSYDNFKLKRRLLLECQLRDCNKHCINVNENINKEIDSYVNSLNSLRFHTK